MISFLMFSNHAHPIDVLFTNLSRKNRFVRENSVHKKKKERLMSNPHLSIGSLSMTFSINPIHTDHLPLSNIFLSFMFFFELDKKTNLLTSLYTSHQYLAIKSRNWFPTCVLWIVLHVCKRTSFKQTEAKTIHLY